MLTRIQRRVLLFIDSELRSGTAPTVRAISEHIGSVHPSHAHQHIAALIERGHVQRHPRTRQLELARPLIADWQRWDPIEQRLVPLRSPTKAVGSKP